MMITQLSVYNSWFWDPMSLGVDALAQNDWTYVNNIVNAPFALLPRVLEVIKAQKATATVIAPWWEEQIWFQTLKSMLKDNPIHLLMLPRTVIKIGPRAEPFKNRNWKLYAWRLCGQPG